MEKQDYFINQSIDKAFKNYVNKEIPGHKISAVDFTVNIIHILTIIYGQDIIVAYKQKDEQELNNILLKYNLTKEELNSFYQKMDQFDILIKQNHQKTTVINDIQKIVINMIKQKRYNTELEKNELKNYDELLYIKGTRGFYNKINSSNPDEIVNYWDESKKQFENQYIIKRVSPKLFSPETYEKFGIEYDEVLKFDDSQKEKLNNEILKKELDNNEVAGGIQQQNEKGIQYVLKPSNVTSGAGFVDKLLLVGIIATISMIAYVAYVYFGR